MFVGQIGHQFKYCVGVVQYLNKYSAKEKASNMHPSKASKEPQELKLVVPPMAKPVKAFMA